MSKQILRFSFSTEIAQVILLMVGKAITIESISYIIHYTSYIIHYTLYIIHHISYIIHHTSYILTPHYMQAYACSLNVAQQPSQTMYTLYS